MLYSEVLKHEEIQKRLKVAGVDHVESWALKNGDWSSFDEIDNHVINAVSDNEILYRRKAIEYQKQMHEIEEKLKPIRKQKAKAEFIRPHFEALIRGKFKDSYATIENESISFLADQAASKYDFDPDNGEVKSEDFSGLSELEKLLKQASVTNLSHKMSPEEIAQRTFLDGPYSAWMK